MISTEQKLILKNHVRPGDLKRAVNIYENSNKRKIHITAFYKFLTGERPFHGRKTGAHNPLSIFEAITRAIQERQQRERDARNGADMLINQIRNDLDTIRPTPICF